MTMISMRLTDQDKKDQAAKETLVSERARYPYGLRINLDPESVKRLGMEDMPEVGKKMVMLAKVEVVNISKENERDDQEEYSMGLQITDLAFEKGEEKGDDVAQAFYGES